MNKFHLINSEEMVVVAKKIYHDSTLEHLLTSYIETLKAGSPTDPIIFWVSQKAKEIASGFNKKHEKTVSIGTVKRLLKKLKYGYRKQSKQLATGVYKNRNLQFEIITNLMLIMSCKSPIISIDCKKKEVLGNLYREGKCYSQEPIKVYDHDYSHLSEGKVIPHGIYDMQANIGYIFIGNSTESADCITDNLRWWWINYGKDLYPDASTLLLLCDAGGANSYRHHIFKDRLLKLTKELGISIVVSHYPPYASKWNPIEHRLFCHVYQAMSGVVFSDYEIIKERIEATSTQTRLTVVVKLNLAEYQKRIKVDKEISKDDRIQRHPKIPELNYRVNP
ncbi:ISAzo13 family transposase [Bernardetia sp. OM2101]|uniref:ISAzo13 family transposase n=1 Tax=Bernardetia sp. OM2101 TaxID=3344876 RepID=UPI0035D0164E